MKVFSQRQKREFSSYTGCGEDKVQLYWYYRRVYTKNEWSTSGLNP